MEKTIVIDGKEVKFKSSGALPLRYRAQFKKEFFAEIVGLYKFSEIKIDENNIDFDSLKHFNLEPFYNLLWVMAKTADPKIPEPLEWYDSFEDFPIMDILPQVQDLIAASFKKNSPGLLKV